MAHRGPDARGQRRLPLAGGHPQDGDESEPRPAQLQPNDSVERVRRIQLNDLENLPYFLVAGFLFLFTNPQLLVAQCLLYGYVATRLLHFIAYLSAQTHDVRAMLWTPGSLILIYLAGRTLVAAFGV